MNTSSSGNRGAELYRQRRRQVGERMLFSWTAKAILAGIGVLMSSDVLGAVLKINDPATSSGYVVTSFTAPSALNPDVSILGVYETRSDSSFNVHPQGAANVHVRYSGSVPMIPLVLVLSAYEPTLWNIDAQAGTRISKIILNGLSDQQVANAGTVPIVNKSGASGYFSACSYAWPSSTGGCDTPSLVQGVQTFVGTSITAYAGVYRATDFTVTGAPVPEPTSIELAVVAATVLIAWGRRRN